MQNPKKYLRQSMDEIVFDGRNKDYGAYEIRQNTNRYLAVGLCAALIITSAISAYSFSNKKISLADPVVISDTLTIIPATVYVPPAVQLPKLAAPVQHATIDFVEMVAKQDNTIDETKDPVRIDELKGKEITTFKQDGKEIENLTDDDPQIITDPVIDLKKDYVIVEQMPEFPGGEEALNRYLANHIKYPAIALESRTEGTVHIQFTVDVNGNIVDVTVVKSAGFGFDEEAIKAIKAMPKWTPGKQQGYEVRVKRIVPVVFRLS